MLFLECAKLLRDAGFNVDMDIKGRNMSKNLKYASSHSAKYVVFLGDDELEKGVALVREMNTGNQIEVKFEELANHF